MKKLTYVLTIALTLSALLFSCTKDHSLKLSTDNAISLVKNVDGRLVFRDREAFNLLVNSLINKKIETLDKFENDLKFASLRRDTAANLNFESFGFPEFYKSIINSKGEYMIGDTIVKFKDGYKYLVPNKDEALLSKIQINPSLATLKFKAGSVLISTPDNATIKTHTIQLTNGSGASYQHEFLRNGDTNSKRKFVFEIWNYIEANPSAYIGYFHTKIKQEYKAGNQWKPTSTEKYNKIINNLSFDIAFYNTGNGSLSHITGSNISYQLNDIQNLDYVLCTFQASQSTVFAAVNGYYSATVEPMWNIDGLSTYTVANANW